MYLMKNNIWRNSLANNACAKKSCEHTITMTQQNIALSSLYHHHRVIAPSSSYNRVITLSPVHCRTIAIVIIITPSSSHHRVIAPSTQTSMVRCCSSEVPGPIQIQCKHLKAYFINCMDFCAFTLKALKHKKAKKKHQMKVIRELNNDKIQS